MPTSVMCRMTVMPQPSFDFFVGDVDLNITTKLLETHLHQEIINNLKCENDFGTACVRSSTMKNFVAKMKENHHDTIHNKSQVIQEMYILYQTCKALKHYNNTVLNFSKIEFRKRILFPNMVYMLVRLLPKANKFLQGTVRSVYSEIGKKSYGVVQRYANSYYLDHDIIKTDVLYTFLGNNITKFNPLEVEYPNKLYPTVFRNLFYYYFKRQNDEQTYIAPIWDIDDHLGQTISSPTRYAVYRDVLYKLQIEKFCKTSPTLDQLNYNFSIFRNVIINNEFQNVYFSCRNDTFMMTDSHYKAMKVNSIGLDDDILSEIKKLPIIYKLLKSVHLVNPKSRPHNEMLIKSELVKSAVLEELMIPFRNMFNDEHVYGILEQIADNFTKNILSGEYINLLTLTPVKISQISFIKQVREFIKLCLGNVRI